MLKPPHPPKLEDRLVVTENQRAWKHSIMHRDQIFQANGFAEMVNSPLTGLDNGPYQALNSEAGMQLGG